MLEANGNWQKHSIQKTVSQDERKDGPAETETRNSGLTGAVMIEPGLPKDKNYLRVLAAVDGISTGKSVRIPRIVPETSTFSHIKN